MNKQITGINEFLKPIIVATILGIISVLILFVIGAFVISKQDIPSSVISVISVICGAAGAFIAGFIVSRVIGRKGFLFGLVSGVVFCAVIIFAGLISGDMNYGPGFFTKIAAITVSASIGGILGVNSKK